MNGKIYSQCCYQSPTHSFHLFKQKTKSINFIQDNGQKLLLLSKPFKFQTRVSMKNEILQLFSGSDYYKHS